MIESRDLRILQHIVQYCDQVNETVELFGNSYDVFRSTNTYRNACCLCILQIGELVRSLTDNFKSEHPSVPWKQIRGMRNIVAHAYGTVEDSVVWEIISVDLPDLREYCQKLLKQNLQ